MRELKDLLSSLPNDENDTTVDNDENMIKMAKVVREKINSTR